MNKMAATSIYGKTLQSSFSPEPVDRFPRNWGLGYIIACSNYDPGLTSTCFTKRSNFLTKGFLSEKVKTMLLFVLFCFSEIIAVCDLTDGRCRHIIE